MHVLAALRFDLLEQCGPRLEVVAECVDDLVRLQVPERLDLQPALYVPARVGGRGDCDEEVVVVMMVVSAEC